ncbi:cytochrome-c peroxidase [Psychroflexus tropicus]|uniref:cytochrome-c peroxidase n=1 Tax=Psychroflexus tropicus TaxID=197345 RepID=UPI00036B888A|nr:cytochrome c peroxidase [Psychroflexus tropicus]
MTVKYISYSLGLIILGLLTFAFSSSNEGNKESYYSYDQLRNLYGSGDQSQWPEPVLDPSVDINTFEDIGSLPQVVFPENNPYSKEKENLGKTLFFDKRLSKSGEVACASCHDPAKAWTDPKRRSLGHDGREGHRNAMSLVNIAFAKDLFWDGRAKSLEHQAKFPIEDPLEMNQAIEIALDSISNIDSYIKAFDKAFGSPEITLERVNKAIATFERTLVSGESKFDKFIKGDQSAYTDEEVLGLHVYRTKANCISCHNSPYFSDNKFHNDGQSLFGTKHQDLGLFEVTKDSADLGKFRTPTLREISETGPWMHHGNFPKLKDVVDYYNLGNPAPIQKRIKSTYKGSLPKNSPILKNLNLSIEEKQALIAFLKTLSSDYVR